MMPNPRIISLGILCAGLLVTACGSKTPPAPPPPEVSVVTAQPRATPNVVEVPGRVQAFRTSEVRARVDGIVQRRLYDEGSDVTAGQELFRIDPREMRASLSAAQATLQRAEATVANAAQDVARYKGLVADRAISEQENDAAVSRLRTAQADVSQARAQLQTAQLNLDHTTVNAPIAGRAGRAQVTEGALVSASGATLLTTIEQLNPIYVNFSTSSADLLKVRREIAAGTLKFPEFSRVSVTLVLEDGETYGSTGHLDFLDLSIDEGTGSAAIRAEFPNPAQTLLPGQFVRARIEAGIRTDALLIPQRAVTLAPSGATVKVVGDDNVVVSKPVKVGNLYEGSWAVLDGLKAGERIIVDGLQKAQPGQKVTIAGAEKPKPSK